MSGAPARTGPSPRAWSSASGRCLPPPFNRRDRPSRASGPPECGRAVRPASGWNAKPSSEHLKRWRAGIPAGPVKTMVAGGGVGRWRILEVTRISHPALSPTAITDQVKKRLVSGLRRWLVVRAGRGAFPDCDCPVADLPRPSAMTVAGAVPDFHRLPNSPCRLFRAGAAPLAESIRQLSPGCLS